MATPKEKMPRTASSQAMQSLFSAYDEDAQASDSGGEEAAAMEDTNGDAAVAGDTAVGEPVTRKESKDEFSGSEDEVDKIKMSPPPIIVPPLIASPQVESPIPIEMGKPIIQKKLTKLVSYGVLEDVNDEDDSDSDDDAMDIDSDVGDEENRTKPFQIVDYDQTFNAADFSMAASPAKEKEPSITLASGEEVRLPPEPPGKCSKHLQQKIATYHEKMLRTGADLSLSIERRKDFRNPSIYEKLIHFVDIDEKGTNYPPSLYNSSIWGTDSFYDHLAKLQKEEMDKREKERKEKTKVEFVTATKKIEQPGADIKSRRSKWDAQPHGGAPVAKPPPVPAAGVATNPTIATVVTAAPSGTKTTVISATGTLKKTK